MSDLVKRLDIKAGVMEMGEKIAWGSDTALMRESARALVAANNRIAELEAENLAFAKDSNLVAAENQRLREAAQAVVDSATPHYDRWVNGVTRICINRLKALLGGEG